MTNTQGIDRVNAAEPWLIWRGLEAEGSGMFRRQLLIYATLLRTRAEALVLRQPTNEETWRAIRRIADEAWRKYRLRCEAVECLTLVGNYHIDPASELLAVAKVLCRCFHGRFERAGAELKLLREELDWLAGRYMGELLQQLRLVYSAQESVGHPLDHAFWRYLPRLGAVIDASALRQDARLSRSEPHSPD